MTKCARIRSSAASISAEFRPGIHLVEQQDARVHCDALRKLEALAIRQRQRARRKLGEVAETDKGEVSSRLLLRGRDWRRVAGEERAAATFSITVISGNGWTIWNVRAMPRREAWKRPLGGSRRGHRSAHAGVGRKTPVIRLTSVVLPAPLGPIRPTISPGNNFRRHVVNGAHAAKRARNPLDLEDARGHAATFRRASAQATRTFANGIRTSPPGKQKTRTTMTRPSTPLWISRKLDQIRSSSN